MYWPCPGGYLFREMVRYVAGKQVAAASTRAASAGSHQYINGMIEVFFVGGFQRDVI